MKKIFILPLVFLIFFQSCSSFQRKQYPSETLTGTWEVSCIKCEKPETYIVSFLEDGTVNSESNQFCKDLFFYLSVKNCKASWKRKNNENRIHASSMLYDYDYKLQVINENKDTFFKLIMKKEIFSYVVNDKESYIMLGAQKLKTK